MSSPVLDHAAGSAQWLTDRNLLSRRSAVREICFCRSVHFPTVRPQVFRSTPDWGSQIAREGGFYRRSEMDGEFFADLGRVQSAIQRVEVIGFGSVRDDVFVVRHGVEVVIG